jgi:hypothetical protein
MLRFCFLLVCTFSFSGLVVHGQVIPERLLEEKISWKNAILPQSLLYITTDKIVYLPTEVIWFSSFLLPYTSETDTLVADMLSVALVNENGEVMMRKTYAIDLFFSSGSLSLTDSIAPGNYQFIAATNLVDDKKRPVQYFRTPIIIRSASLPTTFFTEFDHQQQRKNDTLVLKALLKGADGKPLMSKRAHKKNGQINYGLPGKDVKTAYFDEFGSADLIMPMKEMDSATGVLQTTTIFGGKSKYFNLHSPLLAGSAINLSFYPEGGDLVEGLICRVPYEALYVDGRPAVIKAEFLDNGIVKDVLTTDSAGMGIFTIVPEKNHVYSVRVLNIDSKISPQVFNLPQALEKGMVLNLQQAVTDESLSVSIQSSIDTVAYFAITNIMNNDTQLSPIVNVGRSKKIQIPLSHISKGLNTITILDSQGRPFAECLFFAHFSQRNSVNILLNKSIVDTNQKIDATIQIEDSNRKPIGGVFTIAAVRQNRLAGAFKYNIETYYHLNYSLPNVKITNLYQNKTALERALRIYGWRRLPWQKLIETQKPISNNSPYHKISLKGEVKLLTGSTKLKGPFTVMSIKDSLPVIFETDHDGHFRPIPKELTSIEGSPPIQFRTFGVKGDTKQYITELKDPLDSLIKPLNFSFPIDRFDFKHYNLSQSSEEQLKGEPFIRQLQAVEVKSTVAALKVGAYGMNECGDYVCEYGILNCPIHSPVSSVTHQPLKGREYSYVINLYDLKKFGKRIYEGCQIGNIKGIYTAREFYGVDEFKRSGQDENLFLSTLYWNPKFSAIAGSKNSLSFSSSDATGIYRIIVEGIADNGDFIYAERIITVGN